MQRFRCHTCGIAGDGYDLVKAVEGISDFAAQSARVAVLCEGQFTMVEDTGPPGRSRLASRKGNAARRKLVRKTYKR